MLLKIDYANSQDKLRKYKNDILGLTKVESQKRVLPADLGRLHKVSSQ